MTSLTSLQGRALHIRWAN